MSPSPEAEEFPSPADTRAYKSSASRLRNKEIELSRRASDIKAPDELVSLIFEIAGKKYHQGNRVFSFAVMVPIQNLKSWAIDTKLVSPDMDQLDRQLIRQEITRIIRRRIKDKLAHGSYVEIDSAIAGDQRLSFKVKFNILKHS